MAVRFTDYFVGTQFHPEADPVSFVSHLRNKEEEKIKSMKGEKKFKIMLEDLMDDDKIYRTNETLIPNFLRTAINDLMQTKKDDVQLITPARHDFKLSKTLQCPI
jgi:hypothetical protein